MREKEDTKYQIGNLLIDVEKHKVKVDGKTVARTSERV